MKTLIKFFLISSIFSGFLFTISGCEEEDAEPEVEILSIPVMEGKSGDQLTITGKNFNDRTGLWMDGGEVIVDRKTTEEFTFTIPDDFSSGNYNFFASNSAIRSGYFRYLQDTETISSGVGIIEKIDVLNEQTAIVVKSGSVFLIDLETGQETSAFSAKDLSDLKIDDDGEVWVTSNGNALSKSSNGLTWSTYNFNSDQVIKNLYVGDQKIFVILAEQDGSSMLMMTDDLGNPWQVITTSQEISALSEAKVIYNEGQQAILLDQENKQLIVTDDLKLWASRELRGISSPDFGNVDFYAGSFNRLWYVTEENLIYSTTNGGRNWESEYFTRDSGKLMDIHFFNASEGIAFTDTGSIMRTVNGGVHWRVSNVKGEFLKTVVNPFTKEAIINERDEITGLLKLVKVKF